MLKKRSGINQSNQLLSVSDAGDDSEGFKDGNTSGNDYGYDNNGNMIEDLNKDITSITYNYLNLPHTVEKEDGQRIRYVYDAAGMKLSQITESGEKHTPDLTSSDHGWRTSFMSLDNPTGSIGGESNVQRFTATSGASNHLRQFFKLVPVANQHTKVSVQVYIPSSNTSVDGIRLYAGTKNKNYTPTPDQWTTITYEILAPSNSVKMMMITQNDHKVASVGDEIYFKDFTYTSYSGKTTDYLGEFIYEDDQLQLIQHEEGRIVKDATTNSWEYQYHLKDHLGNTRTTFTTKPKEIVFNVSYEGNTDEFLLQEMDNIVDADIHDYQHQDEETNHTKTQKLTGAANSQVGSVLAIPVGMGDKISAEVYAKYLPTNNQTNPTAAIASLISSAFTGGTGINSELANQAINTSFNGGSMITNAANGYTYDGNGVMAFLNVMFVPQETEATVRTDYFAFEQISNDGSTHEQLSINDFVAPKAGYVLVYLTNEDPTYTEVYFDDLKITLNEHPVIQVDNYYPFGLTHNNRYQRVSAPKNKFLYNSGTQLNDFTENYETVFRRYDPALGRFNQIDALADLFNDWTPYQYAYNDPIHWNDPLGLMNETSTQDIVDDIWKITPEGGSTQTTFSDDGSGTIQTYTATFAPSQSYGNIDDDNAEYDQILYTNEYTYEQIRSYGGESSFSLKDITKSRYWDIFSDVGNGIDFVVGGAANALGKLVHARIGPANLIGWDKTTGAALKTVLVRGVPVSRSFLKGFANTLRVGGHVLGGIGIMMTVAEIRSGQKNLLGEGGLDLAMGAVAFIPGGGWLVSGLYFGGKALLKYTGNDFWNK